MREINTLSNRIQSNIPWKLRGECPIKRDFPLSGIEKIRIQFFTTHEKWRFVENLQCNLSINNEAEVDSNYIKRGRWRPKLNMGGYNFQWDNQYIKAHIIPSHESLMSKENNMPRSTLDPREIHAGELFNYQLLHKLSPINLWSKEVQIDLIFSDQSYSTSAILVEDLDSLPPLPKPYNSSYPIEAVDIFNLHLFQMLIGNLDYCFDYNELGRFKIHNVGSSFDLNNEAIVPIPYDFQFTSILSPLCARHCHYDLTENSILMANFLKIMIHKMPTEFDIDYVLEAIEFSSELALKTISFKNIRQKYIQHLSVLKNKLN